MLTRSKLTQSLSILLVDNDPKFRAGLRTLLDFYREQGRNFTVIGEAGRIETAWTLVSQRQPDLVLLDLELSSEGDGMALLQQLNQQSQARAIVLSAQKEAYWIYRAMQAGAAGYVFKAHLSRHLWSAIAAVSQNEVYLPSEAATAFFRQFHETQSTLPIASEPGFRLSLREEEVLHWLLRGASNETIAQHLYVSVPTVKAHLTSIFQKMHVSSRAQAIVTAMKLGLLQSSV